MLENLVDMQDDKAAKALESQPPGPCLSDEEVETRWQRNKLAIRRLYIHDEMSLKNLLVEVRRLGLPVTWVRLALHRLRPVPSEDGADKRAITS